MAFLASKTFSQWDIKWRRGAMYSTWIALDGDSHRFWQNEFFVFNTQCAIGYFAVIISHFFLRHLLFLHSIEFAPNTHTHIAHTYTPSTPNPSNTFSKMP